MTPSADTVLGCIVGGAIGDCLGGVAEQKRLCLSDDTQLTLATFEAICASGDVSPEQIAAAFLRWFRAGRISGIGSATLKALCDLRAGAHWALAGARGERAAGNGSAMRIAPLAFLLDDRDRSHKETIRDVCRITHHSDEAYVGALAIIAAIRWPIWPPEQEFFENLASVLPDTRVRDRHAEFSAVSWDTHFSVATQFGCSGYVVESIPLALLGAIGMAINGFEPTVDGIGRCGGDADTIGSLAGQVAGAHLGLARLPERLVGLAPVQEVTPVAASFARLVVRWSSLGRNGSVERSSELDGAWDFVED
jgi:ADP-ribosyl-[dinitrogen reductase] hydrolase